MLAARSKPLGSLRNRRGNVLTLTAFLLPVLLVLCAFAINIAYYHLAKKQLFVAADAAARSGSRAFSELQDVDAAIAAATVTAALNEVSGAPYQLDPDTEIQFGIAAGSDETRSRFVFTQVPTDDVRDGDEFANSFRVVGRKSMDSLSGNVNLPLPNVILPNYRPLYTPSTAMQVDRDIALVLDISGSMGWKSYDWPANFNPFSNTVLNAGVDGGMITTSRDRYGRVSYYYASGVSQDDYTDWVWEEYLELGPAPNTPWVDLKSAVAEFLDILEDTVQNERVSLSTYSTNANVRLQLQTSYEDIIPTLNGLSPNGNTAIGRGMQAGFPTLFHEDYSRQYAAKTLIVMTDGIHNTGIDPVTVAGTIASTSRVTIHTVTFSADADQARMESVASIGGGIHYHAESGGELRQVFREIANNLPTILIE